MDDLELFIRERLAEDATSAEMRLPHVQFGEQPWRLARVGLMGFGLMHGHRIVAEVEGKRAILDQIQSMPPAVATTVKLSLAQVWVTHWDFRHEWRV